MPKLIESHTDKDYQKKIREECAQIIEISEKHKSNFMLENGFDENFFKRKDI